MLLWPTLWNRTYSSSLIWLLIRVILSYDFNLFVLTLTINWYFYIIYRLIKCSFNWMNLIIALTLRCSRVNGAVIYICAWLLYYICIYYYVYIIMSIFIHTYILFPFYYIFLLVSIFLSFVKLLDIVLTGKWDRFEIDTPTTSC